MDSNESSGYSDFRKKRVKFIKRLIVSALGFFIALPNILCVILFVSVYKTNLTLDSITNELNTLKLTEVGMMASNEGDNDEEADIQTNVIYKVQSDAEEYADYQRIYFTFDDGPSIYTNELLDLLEKYDVKATFFVIAKDGCEDKYKRIVNEGHTLGIHSYNHVYSDVYADYDGFKNDVNSIYDFVTNITGQAPLFYRFPGGSSNTIYKGDKDELISFLDEKNLTYYDWNVTSNDATYGGLSSSRIAENILKGIEGKDDAVILLHDANDKHSTIEALEIVIQKLQCRDDVIFLPITENTVKVKHAYKSE